MYKSACIPVLVLIDVAESDSRYWLMCWSARLLRLVADSATAGGILPA